MPDQTDLLLDAAEVLPQGVAVYDNDERLVHCNAAYRAQFPPLAGLLQPGMAWRTFLQRCIEHEFGLGLEDEGDGMDAACDRLRRENTSRTTQRRSGDRVFDLSYLPMPNGGFVITREDVTEKARAEADAAHHSALLTRILETNPIPVVMARLADSKIVWRSPAAVGLIGRSEFAIDHFEDPSARAEYVARLQDEGKVEDFRTRCKASNGKVISVALSGMLTEFEGETCVVSSITDLTEILDREALLRKLIEACPAPVLMNRAETGEILYRSPELVALFGDGLDATRFYADPADRAGFLAALRKTGEVYEYRERMINAAGEPFWAAVSGRLTEWNGEDVLVTFTRDLTHQLGMEAELDRQRDLSFQNEKMSALGGLLAGVAHELNNPLSVVVGHAMMLQEERLDDASRRQIAKISEAAERCARIVKTFLSMARQEPSRVEPVDLNEIVQIAAEVARYGDDAHAVRIDTALADNLPVIEGDADQLTQLAINLIINAEQAIAGSGQEGRVQLSTAIGEGCVILAVEDNGPGVPVDVRKRVFEPFFTTKGVGQGTGLGLSMCHQIASSHRGTIRLENVDGGGARFVVELPSSAKSTTMVDERDLGSPAQQAAGRVLVIDDEVDVAELNAEVLTRAGYDAVPVSSVADGLALLEEQRFDIVLSDLNMPVEDGRTLYEAILAAHPDLAYGVGFITGDTLGRASQAFLAEAGRPYLEKPVSPRELRDFVDRLRKEVRP